MALLISNQDAEQVLTMRECLESIEAGVKEYYEGDATCRPRIDVWAPAGDPKGYYQWGSMEGTSRRFNVFATRIKSDIAYWTGGQEGVSTQEKYCQEPGKFCGLILLFSTVNGEPLAIMNDGFVQHMRVGATAGLGAKYLAREDANTVAMIGSGGMARTHALAFCAVRKIKRIQVYSPTAANRVAYAQEMEKRLGIEVQPVASSRDALRGAEIIATCTDTTVPVIEGKHIEEGAFITTVKGTTEIDDETLKRVDLFATFAPTVASYSGVSEDSPASRAQRISANHRAYVAGRPEDLARIPEVRRTRRMDMRKVVSFKDLFAGSAQGRINPRQIISMAGNQIQGIQFASVGGLTYQLIKEKGLGREFPTGWLLQDIRN
ncbi:MAG TPA: ornithine cyclodeaminase family protein [Candidatus Binatia bacterium]|jgi:ornithine cyclodeaminase/alanine dehydrogenase-like protein (mu-crystallin family)